MEVETPRFKWLGLVAGVLLGAVLLVAAWAKLIDPVSFAEQIGREGLDFLVGAYERDLIRDCLKSTNGNMAAAARKLGATPRIIAYKVKKYGIDPERYSF